ncbi:AraC family transcriptional regulator [Chitinophaga cymbidii]|uniref:Transcriptional regulator n=1 Tax=Chitinophaga cymbidii TaxID=1096750 RepID=A0A512RLX4_9BACT|nr:AraC family transcriptional regulator [Chitinophaga cymbidii]GEP96703.1 transcriptional regulator [Chitinophaga cymbidii]
MKNTLFANVKYPAFSEEDENWGLTVASVGYQCIAPFSAYPPKGHPSPYWFNPSTGRTLQEYQLIYITKGKGYFSSAHLGQRMPLEAGELLMLFPNEWHTYYPERKDGWSTYWVGFKGGFADNLVNRNFFQKTHPIYHIGFNELIVDLFNDIIEITKQEKTGFQQITSGMTMHLLGLLYYIIRNNQFEHNNVIHKIEQARLLMREHPGGDISLEEIASSLNMSYSWFRKMFRQYTGLSPTQYQLQIKLRKAKALLLGSSMTIKEIAFLLNFESANYFTLFFKQKTGITPGTFRTTCRGKLDGPLEFPLSY